MDFAFDTLLGVTLIGITYFILFGVTPFSVTLISNALAPQAYCALLDFSLVVGSTGSGVGSSNGGGGGVVSITQPIHMHIVRAARTARITGRAMARQLNHAGNAKYDEKTAAT
jgi:hypothetical protein